MTNQTSHISKVNRQAVGVQCSLQFFRKISTFNAGRVQQFGSQLLVNLLMITIRRCDFIITNDYYFLYGNKIKSKNSNSSLETAHKMKDFDMFHVVMTDFVLEIFLLFVMVY